MFCAVPEQFSEHVVMRYAPFAVLVMCWTAGPLIIYSMPCIICHTMFGICFASNFLYGLGCSCRFFFSTKFDRGHVWPRGSQGFAEKEEEGPKTHTLFLQQTMREWGESAKCLFFYFVLMSEIGLLGEQLSECTSKKHYFSFIPPPRFLLVSTDCT